MGGWESEAWFCIPPFYYPISHHLHSHQEKSSSSQSIFSVSIHQNLSSEYGWFCILAFYYPILRLGSQRNLHLWSSQLVVSITKQPSKRQQIWWFMTPILYRWHFLLLTSPLHCTYINQRMNKNHEAPSCFYKIASGIYHRSTICGPRSSLFPWIQETVLPRMHGRSQDGDKKVQRKQKWLNYWDLFFFRSIKSMHQISNK